MESKKRILVVDDEHDMVELLKMRLEAAGYDVITAADGQEGWNAVKKFKPDLIVLDVMMPKLDGYHMCRLVKFDASYRDIPLIMLTARGQENDRVTGSEVGADEYIIKPFDGKVLLNAIEKHLKGG